jgi:glutathione synthase/RimK-type ligase-like ATP-grasp enzyme
VHISFVTNEAWPSLTPDDQLLADYLRNKGVLVTASIWNDKHIDWSMFDAIILRSTWDYHQKIDEFKVWLKRLEAASRPVLNPVSIVKWNLNKGYLVELHDAEKHVPPFAFCRQNSNESLQQLFETRGFAKAVVKPAVSGGSFNTWVSDASSAIDDEPKFKAMLDTGDVIVQKFMDEIVDEGELSLMFFNKKYSHTILKRAKQGDFRVQSKFGGTVEKFEPAQEIVQYAESLLTEIKEPLLYARVDGVVSNGRFYLMELELIEPALFMEYDAKACENFYRALQALSFRKA